MRAVESRRGAFAALLVSALFTGLPCVSAPAAAQGSAGLLVTGEDGTPASASAPPLALETLVPVGAPAAIMDRAELRGRVVLVHFFATWCEPCREELPALNRLATRFADRPMTLLAVDVGEVDARVRRFLETTPVAFPILMDRERLAARAWEVSVLPSSVLVGPDGRVHAQAQGPVDWDRAENDRTISALFPLSTPAHPAQDSTNPPSGGPTQ
ncbi:TlpA family protein disulfide reductase [Roseixanthobacter pseudopolyaromaticivorans]|uniref:TlpA family protein disulfide reductase n=1 Tax=Xanthobacteraceae TaxID=335928 RepID=UPI003726A92F